VDDLFDDQSLFDRGSKKPENLRRDLHDPNIKWIIFINPPFATAQKAGHSGESKKSVSDTKIRPLMHAQGLGEVRANWPRNFFSVSARNSRERKHTLAFSTKIKYINSNNDQDLPRQGFSIHF